MAKSRTVVSIFHKPIRFAQCLFFFKKNSLNRFRLIVLIPKYIIKYSSERNKLRRLLRGFILRMSFNEKSIDLILTVNRRPKNLEEILYMLSKTWVKFF